MNRKHIFLGLLCPAMLAVQGCQPAKQQPLPSDKITVDQCGYAPTEAKMALLFAPGSKFSVVNAQSAEVLSGQVGAPAYWAEAGDSVSQIDFSQLTAEGEYRIIVDDSIASPFFRIGANIHHPALRAAARAFYYNRCSMAISSECGGAWARPAGHPDTAVLVHSSAASAARPEGTVLSMPGGWYDAGDYNKYIVNSSITTYSLLLAANLFPSVADTLSLNIPESGSGIPDLTSEMLYNLRWMLSMQDPNDGGVYTKLTSLHFEGFIMPADCHLQRYVVAKSTAAALDLAATAAYASRILPQRSESLKTLADSCKAVAVRAYAWARQNPDVIFTNPADVSTGEYGDADLRDEWFWAATEMWLTTGNQSYADEALAHRVDCSVPAWGGVGALAYFSMIDADCAISGINPAEQIQRMADSLIQIEKASPAALGLAKFDWGSNSEVANGALVKILAAKANPQSAATYMASVRNDIHYIFGRNAVGFSFVTGIGSRPAMNPHHRPSAADGIPEPVPGFLVGGPNVVVPTDCGGVETRSQFPAKAYADQECSYSTNEIAINWNSPLVFILLADMAM